ncbi:TCP-1/cpn60 chaperonin family protein [Candidatus Woesearchaeota archaeon]|nr:TCP-1/cpn60 chaperonin family protein [Candidatus Woesearchaeota archaeon]
MSKQVQPIYILPENSQRTTGKTAQQNNIMAAKLVGEIVRTTLGPKGMDKMIVDSMGEVTITNDGVTILEEMQIEHPAAKMIVEVAKTQEEEVGDGTTTAVILAGELLKQAESLLEKEIHPTVIVRGYRQAATKAIEILNKIAQPITKNDTETLIKIAQTAITGKGAESSKEKLSTIAVNAVRRVIKETTKGMQYEKELIKIEKSIGGSVEDTELIEGVILDKEPVHPGMPETVENARIALLDTALEIKNTEIDAKISITDPSQMQAFIDQEETMLRNMVNRVLETGANVVFTQKGIDDIAQHFFAKHGVYAARRLKKSDMEAISKATGANIVTSIQDLTSKDLGIAGRVRKQAIGDQVMTYVEECKNPQSVTILVHGGTEHIVDEVKRSITDALGDVAASLKSGKVVAGAGAPEVELSKQIRLYSETLSGREQLAVRAFAEAMEVIPRTLAENAGLDPIDVLAELKASHDQGRTWAGIDVFTGQVVDAWRAGVIEPLKIKTQAISSASEVAQMILRIDDVIAGGPTTQNTGTPQMPNMDGM